MTRPYVAPAHAPALADVHGVLFDVDGTLVDTGYLHAVAWWQALRCLPGARELVRLCHEAGKITVLASSAKQRDLAVLRRVLDVDECLDHATASDDADNSKPSPDLVLAALEVAGLSADEAVFVGDAVWDVHAAHEAKVPCVAVECGGTSEAELREAGALAVFRDPADLAAYWAGPASA